MKVSSSKLIEICELLGLHPNDVMEIHMYRERVRATVFVHDSRGVRYLTPDEMGHLTVVLDMPVEDDEEEGDDAKPDYDAEGVRE